MVATQHRHGATQRRPPQQLKGAALCCAANGRGAQPPVVKPTIFSAGVPCSAAGYSAVVYMRWRVEAKGSWLPHGCCSASGYSAVAYVRWWVEAKAAGIRTASAGRRRSRPRRSAETHRSCLQSSAVQRSAVQCSAVQCSAVQCSAVQCSAVQCSGGISGPSHAKSSQSALLPARPPGAVRCLLSMASTADPPVPPVQFSAV
jgi:hypothetical protein